MLCWLSRLYIISTISLRKTIFTISMMKTHLENTCPWVFSLVTLERLQVCCIEAYKKQSLGKNEGQVRKYYMLLQRWYKGNKDNNTLKLRLTNRTYCNIAVGLDMIHPEATNRSSFTKKLLHSSQGKWAYKPVNSQRSCCRFLRWWHCKTKTKKNN